MSRTTTNLGLTAVTNSETIGDFSDAMNASGGNLDIIDAKMGAVGNTSLQAQVTALNSKTTKKFAFTSSGADRNAVLHAWMADVHSSISVGEIACMTGVFQSTMYYGVIAKVVQNVIMGHLFTPNSASGFYFRDGSADVTATSTDFSL